MIPALVGVERNLKSVTEPKSETIGELMGVDTDRATTERTSRRGRYDEGAPGGAILAWCA